MLLCFQLPYVAVILSYCLGFYCDQFGFDGYFCVGEPYEKWVARAFFGGKLGFSNGCKIHNFLFRRLGKVAMSLKLLVFEVMNEK